MTRDWSFLTASDQYSDVAAAGLELVERKGYGHPDALAEAVSRVSRGSPQPAAAPQQIPALVAAHTLAQPACKLVQDIGGTLEGSP